MTLKNPIIRAAVFALQISSSLAMEDQNEGYTYPPYTYSADCGDRMAAIPIIDDEEMRVNLLHLKHGQQPKNPNHYFPYHRFKRALPTEEDIEQDVTPKVKEKTALYMVHHPAYTSYQYDDSYPVDFVRRMADYFATKKEIDRMYGNDQEKSLTLRRITYLSPDIQALSQLEELLLPDNFLTSLPSFIGNLTNLKKLDLSTQYWQGESLKMLPREIGNLTQLESLNLSGHGEMTYIRIELLQNLNHLIELNLQHTQIMALPNLPDNLEHLNISQTRIKHLPDSLSELQQLKSLNITGLKRLDSDSKKLLKKLKKQRVEIINK